MWLPFVTVKHQLALEHLKRRLRCTSACCLPHGVSLRWMLGCGDDDVADVSFPVLCVMTEDLHGLLQARKFICPSWNSCVSLTVPLPKHQHIHTLCSDDGV